MMNKGFRGAVTEVLTNMTHKDHLRRRFVMAVIGLVLISLTIAVAKTIAWGVDPFSVFSFSLTEITGLSYSIIFSMECLVLLSVTFLLNRRLLGFSTLFMMFVCGYLVDFFYRFTERIWPEPDLITRIVLLVVDLLLTCVAAALYYTADIGVSPYDAQALTIGDLTPIPFKYARIGTDIVSTVLGFVLLTVSGSEARFEYLNFATVIFAFGMGPIIAWCRTHITEPILNGTFGKKKRK